MTRITATVDKEGRLLLPEKLRARLLDQHAEELIIEVPDHLDAAQTEELENPFLPFIGVWPPLDTDSRTYYRRERGHEDE